MFDLQEMLTYRRPHRSRSERKFINRFVRPVIERAGGWEDGFGNLICEVGDDQRMMYACHTDTVDNRSGRKRVFLTDNGHYATDSGEDCLGADDTTGVWLMLNLIQQGKPGLYVFHRAEERGCLGSAWIAANSVDLLEPVKWCLSLDRKGYGSIVTHQMGVRCASEAFSRSLGAGMDLGMHNDDTGVYTDSVEYVHLIPECTNISVGYHNCHSSMETQDYGYALAVLRSLSELDYDALVTKRDPEEDDTGYAYHQSGSTDHWNADDRYLYEREENLLERWRSEDQDRAETDISVLEINGDAWDKSAEDKWMEYSKQSKHGVNPYWPETSDIEWG